jgi:hypothetical protein
MIFFNSNKSNDLIKLLRASRQDFNFDQKRVKLRIEEHLSSGPSPVKKSLPFVSISFPRFGVFNCAVGLATILLLATGTLAAASSARPGDKLFGLNKFREQLLLTLPFSPETRAQLQANIVVERLKALDDLPTSGSQTQAQLELKKFETVSETDASLTQAAEVLLKIEDDLKIKGNPQAAEKIRSVLTNMIDRAEKSEATLDKISSDEPLPRSERLEAKIKQLKETRRKLREQREKTMETERFSR